MKKLLAALAFLVAGTASGATWYVSATGSGTTCTTGARCTVATAFTKTVPGDTIILGTGRYTGTSQMLTVADSGSAAGGRITIQAETDGGPFFDGEYARQPVTISGRDYITITGIDACCAQNAAGNSNGIVTLGIGSGSNDVSVLRSIFWDASIRHNAVTCSLSGASGNISNILLEDVICSGTGRKSVQIYNNTGVITMRRLASFWQGSIVTGPKVGASPSYYAQNWIVENSMFAIIAKGMPQNYTLTAGDGTPSVPTELWSNYNVENASKEAFHFGASIATTGTYANYHAMNGKFLGSLVFFLAPPDGDTHVGPEAPFDLVTSASVDSEAGRIPTIDDVVSIAESGSYQAPPFILGGCTGTGCTGIAGKIIKNTTGVSTASSSINTTTSGWNTATNNVSMSSSPTGGGTLAVHKAASNFWTGSSGGTPFCKKWIDGTQTATNFMGGTGWPMNDRFNAAQARTQYAYPDIDINTTVYRLLGDAPAGCGGSFMGGPTPTPTNTATNTPTRTPTRTSTNTSTRTSTPTNTRTNTPTNTLTPTNTHTPVPTNTPPAPSFTPTSTPTNTRTPTLTNTPTNTPTNTSTSTPSQTPTEAPTPSGLLVARPHYQWCNGKLVLFTEPYDPLVPHKHERCED